MLTDPLSIPQDKVEDKTTPIGEPVVLTRTGFAGSTSEWKYPLSETPAGGSVAETLKASGITLKVASQVTGKGANKVTRLAVRIDGSATESDLVTKSNVATYTVYTFPTDLNQRPIAMALAAAQHTFLKCLSSNEDYAAFMDGQR